MDVPPRRDAIPVVAGLPRIWMVLSHPLRDRLGDYLVVAAARAEGTPAGRDRAGAARETRARILGEMDWLPHFGGSVLALVDRGCVIATITGPHPAGWALTIEATRATTMHQSIADARAAGETLAGNARKP